VFSARSRSGASSAYLSTAVDAPTSVTTHGSEVVFTATARRDLQRIPPRIVPAIIEFAFGDLAASPLRVGKPLARDLGGYYGARRGPYRLIYEVDEENLRVNILRVAHRGEVYRP
jgi:mRNA interferase RelE/StbE